MSIADLTSTGDVHGQPVDCDGKSKTWETKSSTSDKDLEQDNCCYVKKSHVFFCLMKYVKLLLIWSGLNEMKLRPFVQLTFEMQAKILGTALVDPVPVSIDSLLRCKAPS